MESIRRRQAPPVRIRTENIRQQRLLTSAIRKIRFHWGRSHRAEAIIRCGSWTDMCICSVIFVRIYRCWERIFRDIFRRYRANIWTAVILWSHRSNAEAAIRWSLHFRCRIPGKRRIVKRYSEQQVSVMWAERTFISVRRSMHQKKQRQTQHGSENYLMKTEN